VGGNQKLKEKYGASVIGYKGDQERIPQIDILLNDQETWICENFEAKIIYIPGHTLGHICFYFYKEQSVFTGDTLFSLGCGRIFEGTYSQMFSSLMKLKELPQNTKVYCGHEYTKKNSDFCVAHDAGNKNLKIKIQDIDAKLKRGLPTIPSTIKDELKCNIFLRSNDLETFSKLRDLKDNF
jgi:hydroxyacylglutathione hydrolase